MSKELENRCQVELETLLLQRAHVLKKSGKISSENCKLPHYKTVLSLYKALEESELFLLEINDKIKALERQKEIEEMKTVFSSLRLKETFRNDSQQSSIRNWHQQILLHMENEGYDPEMTDGRTEKLFFDIDFHEKSEKESLTWTTLYQGRAIRVSVCAPVMCNSADPTDYVFHSSFYVNGLVDGGKDFISTGKTVKDYTKFLWTGLQTLIDVT